MSQQLLLKCRSKNGQHTLDSLNSNSTIMELKALIISLTDIDYNELVMKSGFPPTRIVATDESLLTASGIQNGDIIIVEESKVKANPLKRTAPIPEKVTQKSEMNANSRTASVSTSALELKRCVVPADNSCLFASIHFCLRGYVDRTKTQEMRRLVAEKVKSDRSKYNDAFLGQTTDDYARWIMTPDAWGGAIEIAILSDHYAIEIDVVDIENTRIEKFGERKFSKRILLIYDGIHYDPLYLLSGANQATMYPTSDDSILALALSISEREQSNRKFTNTKKFKLRCLVCQAGLVGAVEANEHAQSTGHINFGEC